MRRETDRAGVIAQVVQAQHLRLADEDAEDPPSPRQVADFRMRLRIDSRRDEALELSATRIDYSKRRVARLGQFGCSLDQSLKQRLEREFRRKSDASLEQ